MFDPAVVFPEYKVEGRRVDFALLTHGRPAVFVEVKQPGMAGRADRQLFEYAFHEGVPLAILTDGATWHVYVPALQGSYDDRRVYLLDLLEREPEESADRLTRYLAREAVESGEAEERARADYKRSRQRRGAEAALPQAWANLAAERGRLSDLLAAEVESVSGYQPDAADVTAFLVSLRPGIGSLPAPSPTVSETPPRATRVPPVLPMAGELLGVGFALDGHFTSARSGRDVLVKVFQALAQRDPAFLDRFVARPRHGRTRRFLATAPEHLFPDNPAQATSSTTAEVKPGYWVLTKLDRKNMTKVCRMAAEEAGVAFGRDLRVRLK